MKWKELWESLGGKYHPIENTYAVPAAEGDTIPITHLHIREDANGVLRIFDADEYVCDVRDVMKYAITLMAVQEMSDNK